MPRLPSHLNASLASNPALTPHYTYESNPAPHYTSDSNSLSTLLSNSTSTSTSEYNYNHTADPTDILFYAAASTLADMFNNLPSGPLSLFKYLIRHKCQHENSGFLPARRFTDADILGDTCMDVGMRNSCVCFAPLWEGPGHNCGRETCAFYTGCAQCTTRLHNKTSDEPKKRHKTPGGRSRASKLMNPVLKCGLGGVKKAARVAEMLRCCGGGRDDEGEGEVLIARPVVV